jgi:cytochrome c-type biogenesis protein CcsB
MGETSFLYDGTLIVLAVISYSFAAVIGLVELYASQSIMGRWGIWLASTGLFFNIASWGTRWVGAGDREHWERWVFRYVPFANLYDLSLAFAMGAGLATVIICRKKEQRAIMGISTVLASLILLMAIFIGRSFINLPPVLDSYWRPIHVGIASLSYGVTLVCFSVAVLYLIKDGVKIDAMMMFIAIFGLGVYAFIGRSSLFSQFSYSVNVLMPSNDGSLSPVPFRADIPGVGGIMVLAAILLLGAVICFGLDLYKNETKLSKYGNQAFRAAAVLQILSVVFLFYQMRTMTDVASHINIAPQMQYQKVLEFFGGERATAANAGIALQTASEWIPQNKSLFKLGINSNPVEFGALFTLIALSVLIILFSFRTERVRERLPSREKLDSLVYKTAAVAFTGLALLLMTGAVWANESWGRYWGWDSKETGAFVAWVAYAGFLHTRIAHGWSGRKSAYFAIIGFLLVIFTYLGVSYLLPGLHSYA